MDIPVFLLDPKIHNRNEFDCGEPVLNDYLAKFANKHASQGISKTQVWLKDEKIAGFYSLSMGSFDKAEMPSKFAKHFPNYPIPIARISRLAVDLEYQDKGNGSALLVHALITCFKHSQYIGMVAVIVDAKGNRAKDFYKKHGFEEFPNQTNPPFTLYMPMKHLKAYLEE
jgi:ribosomal protein S18 acetylase RimI-like enzyme